MGCTASMEGRSTHQAGEDAPMIRKMQEVKTLDTGDDTKVSLDNKEDGQPEIEPSTDGEGENGEDSSDEGEDAWEKKKQKKTYTEEEIDEIVEKRLNTVKENLLKLSSTSNWKDEDGAYSETVIKIIRHLQTSYSALKGKCSRERIRRYRHQLGKVLLEHGAVTKACCVIVDIYPDGWANEAGKTDLKRWGPLMNSTLFLLNFSDDNEDIAVAMTNEAKFMDTIHGILVGLAPQYLDENRKLPVNREKMLGWSLAIVHNTSKWESNLLPLRNRNFMEVLVPFLCGSKKKYCLEALASLAAIINEEESGVIHANTDSVKYLLTVLRKGLDSPSRRHVGWSVQETTKSVRDLARNDANKKLLVKFGALELCEKVLRTGSIEEQREAAGSIWALTFDDENQTKVIEDEQLNVMPTLMEAKKHSDFAVRQAVGGALWNCREKMQRSTKYRELAMQMVSSVQPQKQEPVAGKLAELGHVMISYQWSNQQLLIKVRDVLKAAGFKVWMDVDNMGGSTVQAMAEAVENAHVFLMCMTSKYKNSPNCRAEAEYAFQLRKTIVPLLLETGYKADGWLGFILGAKLFYDFSGKYPFEPKMESLVKALDVEYGKDTGPVVAVKAPTSETKPVSAVPTEANTAQSGHSHQMSVLPVVSMVTLSEIRQWQTTDVANWVNKNQLPVNVFGRMTGGEVAMLVSMKREAPEFFYRYLQDLIKKKDPLTMSQVVWGLEDLIAGR